MYYRKYPSDLSGMGHNIIVAIITIIIIIVLLDIIVGVSSIIQS